MITEPLVDWKVHKLPIYDLSDLTEGQRAKYIPAWLYDEFDLFVPAELECELYYMNYGVDGVTAEYRSKPATYSHNVILCNGSELRILFTEFHFMYIPEGEEVVDG